LRTDIILNFSLKGCRIAVDEGIHDTLESESRVACPGVKVGSNVRKALMGKYINSQFGLTLSGEATTIPELAPEAQAPEEPMLHSMSCPFQSQYFSLRSSNASEFWEVWRMPIYMTMSATSMEEENIQLKQSGFPWQ
jgi:hypothetical protein